MTKNIQQNNVKIKEKISTPQDKLFRDLLSDKKDVEKIINEMIIETKVEVNVTEERKTREEYINYNELEKYNSSFINSQYRNKEADIVYKIKNTNTFFLIEHQSYMDYPMAYRMLEYGVEIIKSAINSEKMRKKEYRYPKVYLIVIYTGEVKWNSSKEYKEITDQVIKNQENIINAKYVVMDIHNYRKEDLIKDECIIKNVMAIGKCETAEEVKNALNYLILNSTTKEKKYKIWKIAKYMLTKIVGEQYIQELLEKMKEEEIEMFGMLEANLRREKEEIIKRAEKEGRRAGRREGRKDATIELIRNMLKEKINIETISRITNLSKEEIENYI